MAGPGPGGHKPSFKSTKALARRARSFKDDFLGKISQMRTPGSGQATTPRSNSPKDQSSKQINVVDHGLLTSHKKPLEDLDEFWKQTLIALKHFR